jgi:hypothetical protein
MAHSTALARLSGWIAGLGMGCAMPTVMHTMWELNNPLTIEAKATKDQSFSRSDPHNLRCVICSRMFPPSPGQEQNERTYCYETAEARGLLFRKY